MQTDERTVVTVVGTLLSWLVVAIGYGKSVGKATAKAEQLRTDLERLEKDLGELETKQQNDIVKLEETIRNGLEKLEGFFRDNDGDQRFLTVNRHKDICSQQKQTLSEIKDNQGKIFDTLASMAVAIAEIKTELGNKKESVSGEPG